MHVRLKRVYDEPHKADGTRILVDRLWPRGLSREQAALDDWMKDIAPSDGLRRWFGHRNDRWEAFRARYLEELEQNRDELAKLEQLCRRGTVTLVFAARNAEQNNAVVIRQWLLGDARRADC